MQTLNLFDHGPAADVYLDIGRSLIKRVLKEVMGLDVGYLDAFEPLVTETILQDADADIEATDPDDE